MTDDSKGAKKFQKMRDAGVPVTRPDGSTRSEETDARAAAAESWFAETYGGLIDDEVHTHGDPGYDVVVDRRGVQVRIDVVSAPVTDRPRYRENLIVNPYSNKLLGSDVLVLVVGPPWTIYGATYTARFLAKAYLRDFGYGQKLAIRATELFTLDDLGIFPIMRTRTS